MSNTAPAYKKLIEVAMPIKEVSAESVRDNSIRTGHIRTLHLWWARRPLPVCRAVVFASLVPDPDDANCPPAFRDAVELLLGASAKLPGDPYKPYDDIPYTTAVDGMEDTPRNRVLMFIGKFSDTYTRNGKAGKATASKDQISISSLIRCENKNDEKVIGRARRLIWVAHNASSGKSASELLNEFTKAYDAIIVAEQNLYKTKDRHIDSEDVRTKEAILQQSIGSFLQRMPMVFDPFAGGGAIPLEASRLGCRSYGNDINPVAHIIQRGSLEFPQRFGKPALYNRESFINRYGLKALEEEEERMAFLGAKSDTIKVDNRLAFDVNYFARKMLSAAKARSSKFYPVVSKGEQPAMYYWARVATCANPSCKAEVPLLKHFYLSKRRNTTSDKWVFINPIINGKSIDFNICNGSTDKLGWNKRGNLLCPVCNNTTDVKKIKEQSIKGLLKQRLIAVLSDGAEGRYYRLPSQLDFNAIQEVPLQIAPTEGMHKNSAGGDTLSWGVAEWGKLFSNRQLMSINILIESLSDVKEELKNEGDYGRAIIVYLSILIDRIIARSTSFGIWHILQETVEHPFGRQAIQMVFDYPEINPFGSLSGSALGQLDTILDYVKSESGRFMSVCENASSGDESQFDKKSINAVVTDPPYYDSIAYADLSDFFYVWLKRTLGDVYPLNFAFPQTPKAEECTVLKHRHGGSYIKAKQHFENKLLKILKVIEAQTTDIVSIMFAHQSTEAWTTLCNSILGADMNITGSWSVDTETTAALKTDKAFLSSSVTVSCRPAQREGFGSFKEVKKEIEETVQHEVEDLYRLGFRGADLLTACFGQAVSVFGKYKMVEKADGSEVSVAELLELARESAFAALLKGFSGDDHTKFYIAWLQLFGFAETDFDDAAKFSRVGLSINVADLLSEHLFVKKGGKLTLASFADRILLSRSLGESKQSILVDQVHRALALYKAGNRQQLLIYIGKYASTAELPFWRVLTALVEVLPSGSDDLVQASGLLADKESVLRESTQLAQQRPSLIQGQLELS